MNRDELLDYTSQLLDVGAFKDYCPNGLQIQGRQKIRKIVSGVTASQALIEQAIAKQADLLLVHHGYFWRNEHAAITGIKYQRIAALIKHDVNLVAYHLPLDAHVELGNNAQLAHQLGITVCGALDDQRLLFWGEIAAIDLQGLAEKISILTARQPQVIGDLTKPIRKIAWCSGGAQHYMEQAIAQGVDVFISGEISEQTFHLAQESGVAYIAAGHHATERYGVQALGEHLAAKFGITHEFVDIVNPV